MTWFILSLLTALTSSLRDIQLKQHSLNISTTAICCALSLFTSILLLPIAIISETLPDFSNAWPYAITSATTLAIGWLLFANATKITEISLLAPLRPLSLLYILLFGQLVFKEAVTVQGALGVFLVLVGAYLVNVKSNQKGVFAPLRNLFSHKGQRLMLLTTCSFGFCALFEKAGIGLSSPLYFSCLENFIACLVIFPILLWQKQHPLQIFNKHYKALLSLSVSNTLMFCSQSIALIFAPTAYVVAVKSLNVLLTTGFGGKFFEEQNLLQRSLAGAITVLGVVVIAFS